MGEKRAGKECLGGGHWHPQLPLWHHWAKISHDVEITRQLLDWLQLKVMLMGLEVYMLQARKSVKS